jgi:heterodisulfide reductase subunit B
MSKVKYYYVTFIAQKNGGSSYGCNYFTAQDYFDIQAGTEFIKKQNDYDQCLILNFIEVTKAQVPDEYSPKQEDIE